MIDRLAFWNVEAPKHRLAIEQLKSSDAVCLVLKAREPPEAPRKIDNKLPVPQSDNDVPVGRFARAKRKGQKRTG